MNLLTVLGLTVALSVAGCAEPLAPITPAPIPSVSAEPSPISSLETAAEVMTSTCEKIRAAYSQGLSSELEWRSNRLSDERFRQALTRVNWQLTVTGKKLRSSGFSYPKMPNEPNIFSLFGNLLLEAELTLTTVINAGGSDYRLVKQLLRDGGSNIYEWMDFHCDSAD